MSVDLTSFKSEPNIPAILFGTRIGEFVNSEGKLVAYRSCTILQCTPQGIEQGVLTKVECSEDVAAKINGLVNCSGLISLSTRNGSSGKSSVTVLDDFSPIKMLSLKDFQSFFDVKVSTPSSPSAGVK
jgi:hypothetical protein